MYIENAIFIFLVFTLPFHFPRPLELLPQKLNANRPSLRMRLKTGIIKLCKPKVTGQVASVYPGGRLLFLVPSLSLLDIGNPVSVEHE